MTGWVVSVAWSGDGSPNSAITASVLSATATASGRPESRSLALAPQGIRGVTAFILKSPPGRALDAAR
ncbi:hypothetical protein OH687_33860 [Burkholderia anthina]|nr:hypothetical protein OH687_33860 [Burkholderia anthina]